jgi:sulfate/thiosulfate transport system substrate-binding protein
LRPPAHVRKTVSIVSYRRAPNIWWRNLLAIGAVAGAIVLVVAKNIGAQDAARGFLNVSYDPTRELYADLNPRFAAAYEQQTGKKIAIQQSHGGSSRQARAVLDGLPADVVTLAVYSDTDALRKRGLLAEGWSKRLPNDSLPYTSSIVFVVRKGNANGIKDWPDLVRDRIAVVTPSPKTSGNGKLSFLAAWGAVLHAGGDEQAARAFVQRLYEHVVVLDSGARGATTTFTQEKVGDVQITWENEALLEVDESRGDLQIVYPSASIRAEPYVAWVDANVKKKGTLSEARAYLEYLYTEEAQEIIARHGYRPVRRDVLERHADRFPAIDLFPIETVARDWEDAQQKFFADDGVFDDVYRPRAR